MKRTRRNDEYPYNPINSHTFGQIDMGPCNLGGRVFISECCGRSVVDVEATGWSTSGLWYHWISLRADACVEGAGCEKREHPFWFYCSISAYFSWGNSFFDKCSVFDSVNTKKLFPEKKNRLNMFEYVWSLQLHRPWVWWYTQDRRSWCWKITGYWLYIFDRYYIYIDTMYRWW